MKFVGADKKEKSMSKYIYYIIRLDFEDGNWGYVRGDFGGEYSITKSPDDCLVFDSHDEAANYYYDHFNRHTMVNGSYLKKVFITTIGSDYPR